MNIFRLPLAYLTNFSLHLSKQIGLPLNFAYTIFQCWNKETDNALVFDNLI